MKSSYTIPDYIQNNFTPVNDPGTCRAVEELAKDPILFRAQGGGRRCSALFRIPTKDSPLLHLTWTSTDEPLADGWIVFYRFNAVLTPAQNAMLMRCALHACPILLKGKFVDAEVIQAA